jgi:glycerophosphoryl diester phosphodiesterase
VAPILLVHHAANRGHDHPPGSLRGLRACLEAGARVVEVDATPVADGDFALLHEGKLERATDGVGDVFTATADQVRRQRYTWRGVITDEPVGLLSQAVALVRAYPHLQELQLDLKPHAPLTGAVLENLLRHIEPVKSQIRVTSVADWALRRLRGLAPDLSLGVDPLLYLDVETGAERHAPPFRVGVYGYRDDHPLSTRVWGAPADYLSARAEALWVQAPAGAVWYIRASLLDHLLDDGFDWIAYLHARGVEVDAWTLDADKPGHLERACRLVAAGVDRITTNDAPRLAAALGCDLVF